MALASLNSESHNFLQFAASRGKPPYKYETIPEAREVLNKNAVDFMGQYDFTGRRTHIKVPTKQIPDGLTTYVYTPSNLGDDPPIFVFFHGGGMVMGEALGRDVTCKALADQCCCIIVNVEYRLAPEHKHPSGLDDGVAVTQWVLDNRETLGGTSSSPVGVGGDSAGGNISASVCHDVRGLAFQILIYPAKIVTRKVLPSHEEFKAGPVLDTTALDWFAEQTFHSLDERYNVRCSSIDRENFTGLPPALFVVAELDAVRDESYAYEEKLRTNGVATDLLLVKGVVHTFFGCPAFFPESTKIAYAKVGEFVKKFGSKNWVIVDGRLLLHIPTNIVEKDKDTRIHRFS